VGTPRLNGKVERSHRTGKEEFYQLLTYTGDVDLNMKQEEWQNFYNYYRPHSAPAGKTPYEMLREKLNSTILRMTIREKVATSNPCDELPKSVRGKIPARRKRSRRLSSEEEKALFGVGFVGRREHLRPVSEAARCTGMRKGELFRLKRQDLNFGPATITRVIKGEVWEVRPGWLLIERSKNGRPRVIPMCGRSCGGSAKTRPRESTSSGASARASASTTSRRGS
jgi:integrase